MHSKPNNENNQKQPNRPNGLIAFLTERPFIMALWYIWPPLLVTLNLGSFFQLSDHQLFINVVFVIVSLTFCGLSFFTKIKPVSWWDWPHLMVGCYGSGWLLGGGLYLTQGRLILLSALLALGIYFGGALKMLYDQHRLLKKFRLLKRKLREQRQTREKPNQPTHKK